MSTFHVPLALQGCGFNEDGFRVGMAATYDTMGKVYQPINTKALNAPAVAYKACKPLAVSEGEKPNYRLLCRFAGSLD
jgi:hypothetical protein